MDVTSPYRGGECQRPRLMGGKVVALRVRTLAVLVVALTGSASVAPVRRRPEASVHRGSRREDCR
jgi:hypothetical protein